MWKNLIGPLTGKAPAAQGHNHAGDEEGDDDDDQSEEGGEDAFTGDEYWDAIEENDYSWICRACIGEIDSTSDTWQEIGRARVHEKCLVCAICLQQSKSLQTISNAPWFYCESCMELALLEAKLRKGAEVWQIGFLPAPPPPPEEPLVDFAALHDFVAKFVDPASVEEAVKVLQGAGVVGDTPADWHSKLYELALQRGFFRLPLSKLVLSQIHQAVHPREGPPSPPVPEPIEVTRGKLRATVVSAAEFVKHSINWISNNRTVSGYRLPPSHAYPTNLLRLSRYALSLARQILAKAKQRGVQSGDEELSEMQTVVQTIRALVTAMEAHQAEPDLREPVLDGRDIQGNLPRDISKVILGCLDARTLVNCRLVSRWWRTLSDEEELWKQLFQRDWGAHKVITHTWKQAYIGMYKEMHFLSDDVRIVRRLGPVDPSSNLAVGRWCLLGLTRKYHAPPPPIPRVRHPLSSPALLLNLQLSMQQLLDYADLELGSRGCDTSPVLRDRRVVLHMLNRYAKWMYIRTTYPDACLVPTDDIALVWVTHTLRPDLYDHDCKKLYGRVVPREGVTDRALDVLFWDGLRQTEQLWRKHFNTDYSLRPPGFVQEAEDNVAFRLDIAQNGNENPPPEPGYYENFATGGKAQDDPDADEIIEAAEKENAKEPDWQNPFSITVDDVLLDRMWSAYFDRFVRSMRSSKLGNVHAYIGAKSLKNYEKFLYLQLKHPDVELIPNYFIQLALRAHMVNPIAYREDMIRLFGRLPPRPPWAGPDKLMALQRTRELWLEEYGTDMDLEALSSQLNDSTKARTPAEVELEKKVITETDPEDLCSVFVRKSVPIVPSVQMALDNNFCTYSATGLDFATQTYVHCETCIDEGRFAEDEGVCMTCARVCHLGHELSEQVVERPFFCDCGPSGHCNCLAPAGWKPPLTAPPSAQDNTEDGDDDGDEHAIAP